MMLNLFSKLFQVSQESGQLQLVDATGAVDVVVPDFVLHTSLENFYEVRPLCFWLYVPIKQDFS